MRGFRQKKIGALFSKILYWIVGVSGLSACLLAMYLSFFSLPLSFLKPWLFASAPSSYALSAKEVTLVWRRWSSPWELQIDHLKARFEIQGKREALDIPRLYVTPRWFDLLKGRVTLQAVTFSSPTWTSEEKGSSFVDFEQVQKIAHFLFESPSSELLKDLPTHLTLENPLPHVWPFLDLSFQRSSDTLKLKMTDSQGFSGLCTMTYQSSSRALEVVFHARDFSLTHLLSSAGAQTSLLQKMPRLSGTINATVSLASPTHTGLFTLEGTEERLDAIQKLLLKGTWNEQGLTLTTGKLSQGETRLTCDGTLQKTDGNADTMRLFFKAHTNGIALSKLRHLWPAEMASLARTWILEHIPEGEIGESTLQITGLLDAAHTLAQGSLKGQLALNDLTIFFLDGMPPVQKVSGIADFTETEFDIRLTKGQLEGQKLIKGQLFIKGLDLPDQTFLTQLTLEGMIPDLLHVLSYPPLGYPQKIELPLDTLQGKAHTTLDIRFPLERNIELKDVALKAKSTLQNVAYDFRLRQDAKPLQFDKGELTLSVTPEKLELNGKVRLQKEPVTIRWKENFQKPQTRQLILQLRLNQFSAEYWGIPVGESLRGSFPLDIIWEPGTKKSPRFEADLTRVQLNLDFLNWSKKPGQRALLKGRIVSSQNASQKTPTDVKDVSFEGPGVKITGELSLSGTNDLKTLTLSQIHAPHFDCTLSLQKNQEELMIAVKGQSADVGGFLKSSGNPQIGSKEKPFSQKLHLSVDLQKVYAGTDTCLYGMKGIIDGIQNATGFELTSCMLTGRSSLALSPDPEKARENSLTMSLHALSNGSKKFSLQAGNGGYLFKTLGWMENIRKGYLTIEANQTTSLHPFESKIVLEDFTVAKTPFLTQLFMTLASPTSFLNLFSGGKLSFSRFESKASWHKGILKFRRAVCQSINTGISFRGFVDTNTKTLKLRGNLIPAYMINRFLSAIPGLREILTGGKDNGIGATSFKVHGSVDKPVLEVNPVSALTPPFLKSLFAALEEDDVPSETEEKTKKEKSAAKR